METRRWTVRSYIDAHDEAPFEEWIRSIKDKRTRACILQRIDRLRLGNFGDCHGVGRGVRELRIDLGLGFRVYFGTVGLDSVILLCGGDKSSQEKDIARACDYWKEFQHEAD